MIRHDDVAQRSAEWFRLRIGVITASEVDALVTPLWKVKTGDAVYTYLCKKLAEKWRDQPLNAWVGQSAEQGSILEEEARPYLEMEFGREIQEVGFITTDDNRVGCSPDGMLVGEDCGVEIKCPEPHTHISWLIEGDVPAEHRAQVQTSLFVTGFQHWIFASYCRSFPPLIVQVSRDPKAQDAIKQAVESFNAKFDAAYAKLIEMNGGHEPKRFREDYVPGDTNYFGVEDNHE